MTLRALAEHGAQGSLRLGFIAASRHRSRCGQAPRFTQGIKATSRFVDKSARNDLHPTMKPVALVERAIRNLSKSRDVCWIHSGARSWGWLPTTAT